jgi:3-oxoacyl-[acyl-carrier-protein] synthase-3
MRFDDVCIEGLGHVIPGRVVRSSEIEARLEPLYRRLNLSIGRLQLMSGIEERRFFDPGTRPSDAAARAGRIAIEKSGIERARIGCLVHASVCRDFLEPATASVVHHQLELAPTCSAFDLSNAGLGFANAMSALASMIERREIEAGLVVAAEDGGPLVETTIRALLEDDRADRPAHDVRNDLKRAYASLTIGSGAAAAVLVHRPLSRTKRRLLGGAVLADTQHHVLCQGDNADGFDGPLMQTDSEALMQAGNALASRTWQAFQREIGWTSSDVERVVTHQVGVAHRRLLLATLGLDPKIDFPTVEKLGNIGSVSLPLTLSLALEQGFIRDGERTALLGIGSGLQCAMLAVQ